MDQGSCDQSPSHFTIEEALAGQRLDRALALLMPDISRTRLKSLMLEGAVTLNGQPATNPKHKTVAGDTVTIQLPPPVAAEPVAEAIPLDVVFEDDHLLVLDKPAGLVVHPASGHDSGTLVNALLAHCGDSLSGIGGVRRPGIVHRLDKDTTGLLVVAKHDRAHKGLAAQFADHGRTGPLERAYQAIVWGVPMRHQGTVDAPLGRSNKFRDRMAVVPYDRDDAREAITHYTVEAVYKYAGGEPIASLLTCQLETGRTHQIRVHMAHIGHPLVGDPTYASGFRTKTSKLSDEARAVVDAFPRQALHAAILGFEHPVTREDIRFESPLPDDLVHLIEALESKIG